jgi:hypothetical protein
MFRWAASEARKAMNRKIPLKMDAREAWNAWATSGSSDAAAEFFDRVGSWTDGTAAQLTRGAARHFRCHPTRDEVADRLRHELGVLAGGEPVTYLVALGVARRNVIEDLRARPPV